MRPRECNGFAWSDELLDEFNSRSSRLAESTMNMKLVAAVALLPLLTARAACQTIRGVVVDRGNAPVPGVVVQLLDSTSSIVARALSNDRGEFLVTAARAGTYRMRTLRIGYRPTTSEALALRSGEQATPRLTLSNILIALDTVRVNDRSACRAFTDSGAATFAVWEQVRTALTATQLTASGRVIAATTVAYERALDAAGRRVLHQTTGVSSDFVRQPWQTIAPEALRRDGFVVTTKDNVTMYYAPGLDMLLSAGFIEDHCFRLTSDRDRLGVAFEPTPERKRVPEIRGTIWLDRKSSELRSLEYRYANIPPEQEVEARGDLEFVRLRNGAWAITKWAIRMPVLENRVTSQKFGGVGLRLTGIQVTGGELALVRRGADTLWARAGIALSGVVLDSLSQRPAEGATVELTGTGLHAVADARGRFTISNVLPGEYTAEVRSASLDSVSAVYQAPIAFTDASSRVELRVPTAAQLQATACGGKRLSSPGIIFGSAEAIADSGLAPAISIAAEWSELVARTNVVGITTESQGRRLETRADAHGVFRLCGVPVSTVITLRASSNGMTGDPVTVRIPPNGLFARAALSVRRSAAALATLTGLVLVDSTRQPIAGAEVSLPDLAKGVRTDERGAFRFTDVPAGEYSLTARHAGFAPFDMRVTIAADRANDQRILLSRIVTLDSVVVKETERVPWIREFEDHRKIGLGQFFTRADLEKRSELSVDAIVADFRGTVLIRAVGATAYLATKRTVNFCPPLDVACMRAHRLVFIPGDGMSGYPGAVTACYTQIWLDNALMNREHPAEPFDLHRLTPPQIEAIEYFDGVTATPAKYSRQGSECGVLVIHTRRSP
jgi:hypothetical protein